MSKNRILKNVVKENTEDMSVYGISINEMSKKELKACLVLLSKQQRAINQYTGESLLFDHTKKDDETH